MRVLFICSGNSCRSIMAEAIFNSLAPKGWKAASAGTQPTGAVNPRTLEVLRREGIDTLGLSSKSWDMLRWRPDIVISLCARAAGQLGPEYAGLVLRAHWGLDDPALASGDDDAVMAEFNRVYRQIRARIEAFLTLERMTLPRDRLRLQTALDHLALMA
jgi:arsenate reductase